MKQIKLLLSTCAVLSFLNCTLAIEFKALNFLINFISGEFMDRLRQKEDDEALQYHNSKMLAGSSNYTFEEIFNFDSKICYLHESKFVPNENQHKYDNQKQIKVKCVLGAGNGTIQMVTVVKEVVTLLTPYGNSTKRDQPGHCALILFYTKSCPGSAMVAPHFNAIARQFPDIRIAAVDAFQHHNLNTEFGIVGLPTIMLFHQGRPIIKFNESITVNNFIKFVAKHTGIRPLANNVYVTSEDFNGPIPSKVEKETDYCLFLAWGFILLCGFYYFTKSKLCTQIIEMIKRNWRESEAQHEVTS